jgi:hypothetical protein
LRTPKKLQLHLVVYGVFEMATDRCVKVGSTIRFDSRKREYKLYGWFSTNTHTRRHYFDDLSRAGRAGSRENKAKAGRARVGDSKARRGENHPYFGKPGPRTGMHNSEEMKEKLSSNTNNRDGGILTNYKRWHLARGITNSSCVLCAAI